MSQAMLVTQVHGSSLGAARGGLNVSTDLWKEHWKEETAAAISPPPWYSPSKYLTKNPPGTSQLLCTEAHPHPQDPCSSLQPQPLLLPHSLMLGTKQGHPLDTAPSQEMAAALIQGANMGYGHWFPAVARMQGAEV